MTAPSPRYTPNIAMRGGDLLGLALGSGIGSEEVFMIDTLRVRDRDRVR